MPAETTFRKTRNSKRKASGVACIFVDIGGVLLTDGWDHHARKRAATKFKLEWPEMEERHHLNWDIHQAGKLTLKQYLMRVIFHKERTFTLAQFQSFMFDQSKPHPKMIDLVSQLKVRHGLKVAVVSNEGRELNSYRIRKFKLDAFVDTFISSCFIHMLKPDTDIFRLALDLTQSPPEQVVYIENTPMFVQVAETLGIRSILHTDYGSTLEKLKSFGMLSNE